jgi:hypothetical protein
MTSLFKKLNSKDNKEIVIAKFIKNMTRNKKMILSKEGAKRRRTWRLQTKYKKGK